MDDGRVMLRHLIFQFQSPTCLSAPRQAGLVNAPPAMGLDKNYFIEGGRPLAQVRLLAQVRWLW